MESIWAVVASDLNTAVVSQARQSITHAQLTALHILQGFACRLSDQEEGIYGQGIVEDAEHEKRAPSDVFERRGRDACENEVE